MPIAGKKNLNKLWFAAAMAAEVEDLRYIRKNLSRYTSLPNEAHVLRE